MIPKQNNAGQKPAKKDAEAVINGAAFTFQAAICKRMFNAAQWRKFVARYFAAKEGPAIKVSGWKPKAAEVEAEGR